MLNFGRRRRPATSSSSASAAAAVMELHFVMVLFFAPPLIDGGGGGGRGAVTTAPEAFPVKTEAGELVTVHSACQALQGDTALVRGLQLHCADGIYLRYL